MVETSGFLLSEADGILQITLNRPEKLNALTVEMVEGIWDAVSTYRRRGDLRCLLFRATGRYFCAGVDLVAGKAPSDRRSSSGLRDYYRTTMSGGMQALYEEMEAIEKPFVVAHQGTCIGGGLELSLSCDFRLAAQSASYGFPEWKLGSLPASNGISRFTRLVGPHWAKWAIMADEMIDADLARTIGLVHAVYADAEFDARVMAVCRKLAAMPPEMTAMAKLTIDLAADLTAERGRKIERLGQSALAIGDEPKALMARMRERLGGNGA